MCRCKLTITTALWATLVGSLALVISSRTCADENAEENAAVAAIEKLGGLALRIGDAWEVDFHLRGRNITDEDLAHVGQLRNVAWLNLKDTKITGAGLIHLRNLDQLRVLHLEQTDVGDDGIEHLAGLEKLEYLNLYGTKVTDKALVKLTGAKGLRRLYVWRTDVSDAGVARLAKALPELKIEKGLDLSKLPGTYPKEAEQPMPKVALDWVAVSDRGDAPARSENGINCQILFENKTNRPVRLYWISYGNGELKKYGTIAAGATREQNSYARNAWLVTDENDQPLGYFVVKEDDSHAVIPSQS